MKNQNQKAYKNRKNLDETKGKTLQRRRLWLTGTLRWTPPCPGEREKGKKKNHRKQKERETRKPDQNPNPKQKPKVLPSSLRSLSLLVCGQRPGRFQVIGSVSGVSLFTQGFFACVQDPAFVNIDFSVGQDPLQSGQRVVNQDVDINRVQKVFADWLGLLGANMLVYLNKPCSRKHVPPGRVQPC